ncbi:hypothetical protein LCGC14_0245910 [marine sediment metagenome]|uniref:Uncharacterized protein n=1 Tax=marine sediment metagenome TaxID=412755 RepID=A0A0F9U656_9ZZZZ
MSKTVKIITKEVLKDKTKVDYAKLGILEERGEKVTDPVTGEQYFAHSDPKKTSFNAWSKKPWDKEGEASPDLGYNLEVGQRILGSVVTRRVTPYDMPVDPDSGEIRSVDTYSCLVKGDTDNAEEFEIAIERQFRANNHPLPSIEEEAKMEEEKLATGTALLSEKSKVPVAELG